MSDKSNPISSSISSVKDFYKDSKRLMTRCSKPDKKGKTYVEYTKIVTACAIGFAIMGLIGFFVKLVFIPINNILLTNPS